MLQLGASFLALQPWYACICYFYTWDFHESQRKVDWGLCKSYLPNWLCPQRNGSAWKLLGGMRQIVWDCPEPHWWKIRENEMACRICQLSVYFNYRILKLSSSETSRDCTPFAFSKSKKSGEIQLIEGSNLQVSDSCLKGHSKCRCLLPLPSSTLTYAFWNLVPLEIYLLNELGLNILLFLWWLQMLHWFALGEELICVSI